MRIFTSRKGLATFLFIPGAMLLLASASMAASVDPQVYERDNWGSNDGGPCGDLGLDSIWRFNDPPDGEQSAEGITVDLDIEAGRVLSWDSGDIEVGAVFVKGGPVANLYLYPGGETSDTDLFTATNPNSDKPYGISFVEFCAAAEVEPTDTPTVTETPTVLPTIITTEPSEEPTVLGKRLARTGPVETMRFVTAGFGMFLIGLSIVVATRRRPAETR